VTRLKRFAFTLMTCAIIFAGEPSGADQHQASTSQTLYVPVYSHSYGGNKERPFHLAVTLSIRNTDKTHTISLTTVDYYDSEGKLLRHYLDKPVDLGPMASTRYIVKESDIEGGSGANFLVAWESIQPVSIPIVESVMIGTQSQQGISFTSRGQVISK